MKYAPFPILLRVGFKFFGLYFATILCLRIDVGWVDKGFVFRKEGCPLRAATSCGAAFFDEVAFLVAAFLLQGASGQVLQWNFYLLTFGNHCGGDLRIIL